jgi:hypothetical protein
MAAADTAQPFSWLGGPLYQLGRRLGLVRRETNTVLLGLVLGLATWLLVMAVALLEGVADQAFSLVFIGAHARLLLVIPLFFVCESWVAPSMATFVSTIARTGVVPSGSRPALDSEVSRIRRWTNWWWPEAVCLLVAILLEVTGSRLQSFGETAGFDPARNALAFRIYVQVGLSLFRFLLFRWAWKLALWLWLLWRVSRLELHLTPGHPDRSGGLETLEQVHERFTPLVAGFSILEGASLAESVATGTLAPGAAYPTLALLLLLDGVLFLCPLLMFTDKLWAARTNAVRLYMSLASRYVSDFEKKWLGDRQPANDALLGTADIQSLADLANAVNVVKSMRWVPIGPRLLTLMALAALVPLAPLLLFQYSIAELSQKFFSNLVGL